MLQILLDCGEGTSSQLFQACSGDEDKFHALLMNLRLVWISHSHADHICGVPMLLQHLCRAHILHSKNKESMDGNMETQKLCIVAPPVVQRYYEYTACASGIEDLVHFMPIYSTAFSGSTTAIQRATMGAVEGLTSVPVTHCRYVHASRIGMDVWCKYPTLLTLTVPCL